jgi:NADPH-dependent F420 reductase
MQLGIIGGTGPAGRGLALRAAAAGHVVRLGSREAERAVQVVDETLAAWPNRSLAITGGLNAEVCDADLVVMATPWDSATATVRPLAEALAGKVVVSMANALVKDGREMLPLIPPRGSVAAHVQHALPAALVSASFHHLPAAQMADLDALLEADVLVCSDHAEATAATIALIESIEGLRPLDAGSLSQAAPIEAFTAVCISLNIRHRAHSTLRLAGI